MVCGGSSACAQVCLARLLRKLGRSRLLPLLLMLMLATATTYTYITSRTEYHNRSPSSSSSSSSSSGVMGPLNIRRAERSSSLLSALGSSSSSSSSRQTLDSRRVSGIHNARPACSSFSRTQHQHTASIEHNTNSIAGLDGRVTAEIATIRSDNDRAFTAMRAEIGRACVQSRAAAAAAPVADHDTCEVRVSGIPLSVDVTSSATAERIVSALELDRLRPHILSVREWAPRRRTPVAAPSTSNAVLDLEMKTMVIRFSSANARETFLAAAPKFQRLSTHAIFGIADDGRPNHLRANVIFTIRPSPSISEREQWPRQMRASVRTHTQAARIIHILCSWRRRRRRGCTSLYYILGEKKKRTRGGRRKEISRCVDEQKPMFKTFSQKHAGQANRNWTPSNRQYTTKTKGILHVDAHAILASLAQDLYFKNLPVSRRSLNIEVKVVRSTLHALSRVGLCDCVIRISFCDYRRPVEEIVHMLIQKGANIEARNKYGDTPLQAAISCFDVELARTLMKHGASLESLNEDRMFSRNFESIELKNFPLTLNIIEMLHLLQSVGYEVSLLIRLRMLKCWMRIRGNDTDHLIPEKTDQRSMGSGAREARMRTHARTHERKKPSTISSMPRKKAKRRKKKVEKRSRGIETSIVRAEARSCLWQAALHTYKKPRGRIDSNTAYFSLSQIETRRLAVARAIFLQDPMQSREYEESSKRERARRSTRRPPSPS
ncbi:unnamed protein product [Trichogramma brassicae]|uniref:Uncharacterized protein n=1 Tax=Trichogramma brassicae TaxID=86971 RepID=A0A6H5IIT8_9HYME|nr:unnamed protein product [Trichogramma brassicae]